MKIDIENKRARVRPYEIGYLLDTVDEADLNNWLVNVVIDKNAGSVLQELEEVFIDMENRV